jgi:hypothetical protein
MMKFFLKIWRILPMWIHVLAMRMFRPKFRAAVAAIIFDEQRRILRADLNMANNPRRQLSANFLKRLGCK